MDKSSFENLCRLCVQKSNCFMHIDFVQPNDKKPINEVLNYVYDLQVVADDGLPEYICYDCHLKLKEFEKYKMKVHSAKIELMRLKGKVVNTTVIGRVQEDEVEAENHSPPDEDNNNRLQVYIKQEETEGDVYLASEGEQIEEPSQDVVSQASNPSSYLSSSKDTSADGASSSNEMQIKEEEIEIHDSLPSEDNQINASSEVEVANFQISFFVVLAENWCAAVPASWVEEERGVYRWPKNKQWKTTMIRQLVPDSTWNTAPYERVLGPYDTLKEAQEVEKMMAELCAEDEEGIMRVSESRIGKRRIKKRKFDDYYLEGDDYGNVDELPPPPSRYKMPVSEEVVPVVHRTKEACSKSIAEPVREPIIEHSRMEDPLSMSQQSSTSTSSLDFSLVELIKEGFEKVGGRIEKMNRRQDDVENKLDILLAQMRDGGGVGNFVWNIPGENNLPNFPLTSMTELREFERDLRNSEDVQKQLKLKIKVIGGDNPENHMRRSLATLLSNNLAYQLTWMGPQHGSKRGGFCNDSMCFSVLKLCDILKASVLECHTGGSISSLERVGKKWLQHAGDRIKYAEKKRKEN